MKKIHSLIGLYIIIIIGLFLYSYTQVDLSLTLSRASIFQTVEKAFQYIGYFNRPLSTYFYLTILSLQFIFYFIFIKSAKKITTKSLWILILVMAGILTFSYNAFSYDLFNYIFAAKVVLHYGQNPYLLTALDFPHDPMLSFMHWTHNTYQYPPLWLGLTLPFYFLGFGYFLPTVYLFKILGTVCFLGSIYFFQKILHKTNPQQEILGVILYALNPLIIIELLISSHNDSSMMFLALMGIYFILQKKWVWGIIAIILSALTKEVTILLLVPAITYFIFNILHKKFFSEELLLRVCFGIMILGYIYVILKLGIQPWYFIWVLPFAFLVRIPRFLRAGFIGFSLGMLLRYTPFLWQGDWNGMAPFIMSAVTIITPIVFLLIGGISSAIYNYVKK